MIEIYSDIRDEVKKMAQIIWQFSLQQRNPLESAKFLDTMIHYYSKLYTQEEIEFLQFYFQTQMEMMKK